MAITPAPIIDPMDGKNKLTSMAWVAWFQAIVTAFNDLLATVSALTNSNIKLTAEGGLAVKYTNKTGSASVKGEVVTVYNDTAIDKAVEKVVQNVPNAIGVFYESGVADGSDAWVVVSAIAEVYFVGNTTRGHLARTFVTADADYVIGQAKSEAVPSAPFATDKHFCEIGHVLESRTGAGLAKVNLHFN